MTDAPKSLAARLREQYAAVASVNPSVDALLTQACRISDRLDRLYEREYSGDDEILPESRQQALALKQLISQLPEVEAAAASGSKESKGTVLDELERRRQAAGR